MTSFIRYFLHSKTLLVFTLLVLSFAIQSQIVIKNKLVKKGAHLEKLAGGYVFTEGPACDKDGNVYFTDQPNNQIIKWSVDGTVSVFLTGKGRVNGLCFDKQGNLIACSEEKNELWSISSDGKITVLLKEYKGKRFNAPNDVWISPNENIYFTDPLYMRKWWNYPMPEQDGEHVYLVSPDYSKITRITTDLVRPNGIIGTPDGKILYIADLGAKKTYKYKIGNDGLLYDKKLFVDRGSDGMTIDNKGNVYLTDVDGVSVFNPKGEEILHITNPDGKTGNICFGGKKRDILFITALTSVYGLKMNVRGVNPQ